MKQWLEKQFKLSEFHSNVRTELLAGLTTFVTMAYVLATVPNMMESAGLDKHVMFTVLILLVILTTCAMAFYTNRPFALAPGLGSVGIVTAMIANDGIAPDVASGVIFWSGVLFIAISFLGLREAVVKVIPVSLKHAVSAGIGLFIALLGAKSCGLIIANEAKKSLGICDLTDIKNEKWTGRYDPGNCTHHLGGNPLWRYKNAGKPVYHARQYRWTVSAC